MLETLDELALSALLSVSQGSLVALLTLGLVAALTEVGVPFPFVIDGVLLFAGYHFRLLSPSLLLVVLALFLGRLVGGSIIYWSFRVVGPPLFRWLSRHFPKAQSRLDELCSRLDKRAPVAVAFARLTPGLLTVVSIAAGCIHMKFHYFLAGIAIASLIADGVLLAVGYGTRFGLNFFGLKPNTIMLALGIVALLVCVGLFRQFWSKKKSGKPPVG